MRRFWAGEVKAGPSVEIEGELFHHIFSVCRFEVGGRFELLTSKGDALFVEVSQVSKKSAEVRVIDQRAIPELPKPWLHLCVSLPKFAKMDTIIEKSVELGVYQIHPFVSDYSFVKSKSKVSDTKLARWDKIIKGATQQCGRGELMSVAPVATREEILEEFNRRTKAQGLFLYEGECPQTLKSALASYDSGNIDEIWAFIGSEGGFSLDELNVFERQGLEAITMGSQILRVETACLALASIIKYQFGS